MGKGILTEEEALALLAYLTSAAELSVIEPDLYGSFRLVDGASRLLAHLADQGSAARRDFYRHLKDEIDREKVEMMWDRERYVAFVRRLPGELAKTLVHTPDDRERAG